MARTIDQILNEIDGVIGGAQEKVASADTDDDIFKLAESLTAPVEHDEPVHDVLEAASLQEKIAEAGAIMDVLINLPVLQEMASFEKQASDRGFTPEQIEAYMAKNATGKMKSWTRFLPKALAGLGIGAAGTGAMEYGKKKGKEKGYEQGVQDAADLFTEQMGGYY